MAKYKVFTWLFIGSFCLLFLSGCTGVGKFYEDEGKSVGKFKGPAGSYKETKKWNDAGQLVEHTQEVTKEPLIKIPDIKYEN